MSTVRDGAELLRAPALFTLPGAYPRLYGAGTALNDRADREENAAERPHRPIPPGRIAPAQAQAAAAGPTAAALPRHPHAGPEPARSCLTLLRAQRPAPSVPPRPRAHLPARPPAPPHPPRPGTVRVRKPAC
ncbi:hypothetical protein ACIHCQ_18000 [Streptomyces sp. NPDC052236]|uniref:hypothetical protein n=1 Tax=Streptomyces sp. NPDC052236 TaxID=3365686 RepID=UPI0037D2088E